MDYQTSCHSKFRLQYHVILVVKYRKQLLIPFGETVKQLLYCYANKKGVTIEIAEVDKDHLHFILSTTPDVNLKSLIIGFKQFSTYQLYHQLSSALKKDFWYKNKFWSEGFFIQSIGEVSQTTLRHYIENQG